MITLVGNCFSYSSSDSFSFSSRPILFKTNNDIENEKQIQEGIKKVLALSDQSACSQHSSNLTANIPSANMAH
jgi:hypothetical protein